MNLDMNGASERRGTATCTRHGGSIGLLLRHFLVSSRQDHAHEPLLLQPPRSLGRLKPRVESHATC